MTQEADQEVSLSEPCSQYSISRGGYTPTGRSMARLPAGSFDVERTMFGTFIVPKKIVHDELIEMEDSPSQQIMEDIRKFWNLKQKYEEFGFIHKRGFLLYGPPGTGKTSVTNLIAVSMAKQDGLTMYCQDPGALAGVLKEIRQVEPERPIAVVFEDIDSIVNYGREAELLALLDGQDTVGSIVFIATTNYLEELPDRIAKRPSRFDRVIEVGSPPAKVRRQFLVKRGCGSLSKKELTRWVKLTEGLTIAHMKELLISVLLLENDLETEAKRLKGVIIESTEKKNDEDDIESWD